MFPPPYDSGRSCTCEHCTDPEHWPPIRHEDDPGQLLDVDVLAVELQQLFLDHVIQAFAIPPDKLDEARPR